MTALSYFGVIGHLMSTFGSARGAGAHIFHILNKVPSINPLLDKGLKPNSIDGNIELKDISFQYPARPGVTVSTAHACIQDFNQNYRCCIYVSYLILPLWFVLSILYFNENFVLNS